jgi:secreted trypsin-like serine protease
MARFAFLALACSILPLSAAAIIVRHDIPDQKYRELGERYRQTIVDIAAPRRDGSVRRGNGMGTLVAPNWVVTAAHIAAGIHPSSPSSRVRGPHSVYIGDRLYRVAHIFVHPDWHGEMNGPDIALLQLAEPAKEGQPACLYPDTDESGQITTVVGSGDSGTGLTGPVPGETILRGATDRIDPVQPGEPVLSWTFRAPDDAAATGLDGISGPGDSGGPAFLMHQGRLCVAGISSAGDGHGRGPGRYGAQEFYTRVSSFRPWLEEVMRTN